MCALCGGSTFADISTNVALTTTLSSLYGGNISAVDAWAGMLSEGPKTTRTSKCTLVLPVLQCKPEEPSGSGCRVALPSESACG